MGDPGRQGRKRREDLGTMLRRKNKPQAAQSQGVNKLFNSDTVTQRTIYRDCMGNFSLC